MSEFTLTGRLCRASGALTSPAAIPQCPPPRQKNKKINPHRSHNNKYEQGYPPYPIQLNGHWQSNKNLLSPVGRSLVSLSLCEGDSHCCAVLYMILPDTQQWSSPSDTDKETDALLTGKGLYLGKDFLLLCQCTWCNNLLQRITKSCFVYHDIWQRNSNIKP